MDQRSAECLLLLNASLERHRYVKEQENKSTGTETDKVQWTACEDFTVDLGKEQIDAYIQTWGIRPCWRHTIDFLYSTEELPFTLFLYRARFGIPTAQRPITTTASVFFAVEATKNEPRTLPVEVHFVVESNGLVHTAADSQFREVWLANVIENKTLVYRKMDEFDL